MRMVSARTRCLVALCAITAAGCGSRNADVVGDTIRIDGSSTVYPLSVAPIGQKELDACRASNVPFVELPIAHDGLIPLNPRLYPLVQQRASNRIQGSLYASPDAVGRTLDEPLNP